MNSYDLSRDWFNFCFENPEKIRTSHTAIYFFSIEHCNRLGWKKKFGLPTTMVMEAIGIKSYNTYKYALADIVEWGFIQMIQKSKNQHSSNIIALSKFNKAHNKARNKPLDKALIKHTSKQSESTVSIDKPITNNQQTNKPITIELIKEQLLNTRWSEQVGMKFNEKKINLVLNTWLDELELKDDFHKPINDIKGHFINWLKIEKEKEKVSEEKGKKSKPKFSKNR